MKLYQKLGIPEKRIRIENELESLESAYETLNQTYKEGEAHHDVGGFKGAISASFSLCVFYYITDEVEKSLKYAEECLSHIYEYYFGEWRKFPQKGLFPQDPEKNQYPTMEEKCEQMFYHTFIYNRAMWVSVILNEWEKAREISGSIYKKVLVEKDIRDWEIYDYFYYILSSYFVEGRYIYKDEVKQYSDYIEKRRSRKYKNFIALLKALDNNDNQEFNTVFNNALTYFAKRDFPYYPEPEDYLGDIDYLVWFEGTMFLRMGQARGFKVKYNTKYKDFIVKFPGKEKVIGGLWDTGLTQQECVKVSSSCVSESEEKKPEEEKPEIDTGASIRFYMLEKDKIKTVYGCNDASLQEKAINAMLRILNCDESDKEEIKSGIERIIKGEKLKDVCPEAPGLEFIVGTMGKPFPVQTMKEGKADWMCELEFIDEIFYNEDIKFPIPIDDMLTAQIGYAPYSYLKKVLPQFEKEFSLYDSLEEDEPVEGYAEALGETLTLIEEAIKNNSDIIAFMY